MSRKTKSNSEAAVAVDLKTEAPNPYAGQAVVEQAKPSIFKRAVCLHVRLSEMGTMKSIRQTKTVVKSEIDEKNVKASKVLFNCKELNAIYRIDNDIKTFLQSRTLPSILKSSVYLIPNEWVEETDEILEDFLKMRNEAVDAFIGVYNEQLKKEEERLGPLWNPMDYPEASAIKACFGHQIEYLSFDLPETLKGVSRSIFERERGRFQARLAEAETELKNLLRIQFQDLLSNLVGKLTPAEDGKKKILNQKAIDKVNKFVQEFKTKNICNDAELNELISKAAELTEGQEAELIRTDEEFKVELAAGLALISTDLEGMIVRKPKREIRFEEQQ